MVLLGKINFLTNTQKEGTVKKQLVKDKAYMAPRYFFEFFRWLKSNGWKKYNRKRDWVVRNLYWLRGSGRYPESGFFYEGRLGFGAVVWTTWSEKLYGPIEHDFGWVGIYDLRNPEKLLFFQRLRRVPGFFKNLQDRCSAAMEIVNAWPQCKNCGIDLMFQYNIATESEELFCPANIKGCVEPTAIQEYPFDIPEQQLKFIRKHFGGYKKYRQRESDKGFERKTARLVRYKQVIHQKQVAFLKQHKIPKTIDPLPDYSGIDVPA